jgi:hypothetical protein
MPPLASGSRRQDWLFTSFDLGWQPPEDVLQHVQYLIYQRERCPTTGREHFQGFVIFKKRRVLSMAKTLLNLPTAHFEPRMGSREEARNYCRKHETRVEGPWEFGRFPDSLGSEPGCGSHFSSNNNNDGGSAPSAQKWLRLRSMIAGGAKFSQLFEFDPKFVMTHLKGVYELFKFFSPPRMEMTVGIWIYGASGVGKSTFAADFGRKFNGSIFWKAPGCKWFDGYGGETVCVLDDYRPAPADEGFDFPFLLRLVDRYPLKVEVKHGMVEFTSRYVIVTTPYSIESTFPSLSPNALEQLHRRFPHVYEFPKDKEDAYREFEVEHPVLLLNNNNNNNNNKV